MKRKNPTSPSSDSDSERLPKKLVLSPPSKRQLTATHAVVRDSLPMEDFNDAVIEMKKEYFVNRVDNNHITALVEVRVVK